MATMRPTPSDSVLDIGVIDIDWRASNFLEASYPWPDRITAAALTDMPAFRSAFPQISFVIADGRDLPFHRHQFEIGFSNAVIEHVGSRAQQRQFVAEMLRTCRRIFISTPNASFPVDPHTLLPFVHWLPLRWRRKVLGALGDDWYGREEVLNPLSARDFADLFPREAHVELIHQRLLGMSYVVTAVAGLPADPRSQTPA